MARWQILETEAPEIARDGRALLYQYGPGSARRIEDPAVIARVSEVYHAAGATSSGEEWTFEFEIERALLSLYNPRGVEPQWPPRYLKWQARP